MVVTQQPTIAVTMGMSWMVHTLGNVRLMALGMEKLQSAARQIEVRYCY